MISGLSGSGVVKRPPWRSTGLASFSHGQLHFMPFNPVNSATTSVVVVVSLVEGLPGLAYVRRRVVSLRSRNCTSVLLVFVTGDWTVVYFFSSFSSNLIGDLVVYCLILHYMHVETQLKQLYRQRRVSHPF
jgi:hypothetical protein